MALLNSQWREEGNPHGSMYAGIVLTAIIQIATRSEICFEIGDKRIK
jgi:hypothetical protein